MATELKLALAARPENLALVRQALAGLADAASIGDEPLADLKQIATEACLNAVVHGYPNGSEGRIEVTALAADGAVELTVRDWGTGFQPRPATPDGDSLRLGLPLMASLAESFEVTSHSTGGTEIRARVLTNGAGTQGAVQARPAPPREAEMQVTAGDAAKPVIARVIAMAATRAGLSLERMSDGVLIGDVIAGHAAGDFHEQRVGVEIEQCGESKLCIRVGPFVEGGGQRMLAELEVPGMAVSLAKLADRVDVDRQERGEFVAIELSALEA